MFRDFVSREIETDETTVFVRSSGSGPPLLLLHGFPETHLMWRDVAPLLAQDFTVVCADLPGYGQSGFLQSTPPDTSYSKRTMARQMLQVMSRLGFERFSVGRTRSGWTRGTTCMPSVKSIVPLPQDREHDQADRAAGRRIACSVLVLWSENGALDKWYEAEGGPLQLWRSLAPNVQGRAVRAGHFFPEECPEETAQALRAFFKVEPHQLNK